MEKREVIIAALELSRAPGSRDVAFRVVCSKGTYIRSLVNDLVRRAAPWAAVLAAHAHLGMLFLKTNILWTASPWVPCYKRASQS